MNLVLRKVSTQFYNNLTTTTSSTIKTALHQKLIFSNTMVFKHSMLNNSKSLEKYESLNKLFLVPHLLFTENHVRVNRSAWKYFTRVNCGSVKDSFLLLPITVCFPENPHLFSRSGFYSFLSLLITAMALFSCYIIGTRLIYIFTFFLDFIQQSDEMGQKLIKMSERSKQFSLFRESEKIVRLSVWMVMFVCVIVLATKRLEKC